MTKYDIQEAKIELTRVTRTISHGPLAIQLMKYINQLADAAQAHIGEKPDCKCQQRHILRVHGGVYFEPPFDMRSFKCDTPVRLLPVKLNFCPECGRKL